VLAYAIGALAGVPPFGRFRLEAAAVGYGAAATLPLLGLLRWCLRTEWEPMRRLLGLIDKQLAPYLTGATAGGIVLLSLLDGVGEEVLFRGVIQEGLAERLPAWLAVGIGAILFGAAHWLTTTYAVFAALIGAYLGILFLMTGNLLVPTVTHALYDVAALAILARRRLAMIEDSQG
jgi:membrane protease YdiL (CAAX protease family)